MQLIWYEIRKITAKRNLLVTILFLLLALFAFLYMEQLQNSNILAQQRSVYSSIKTELDGKSLKDKKKWIDEKNSFFTQVHQYEEQLRLSEAFGDESNKVKAVNQDFLTKYKKLLQSDVYANMNAYRDVYQYLNTYYKRITGYEAYLNSILEKLDFLKNNPMQITISEEKAQQLDMTQKTYERLRRITFSDDGFLVFEQYVNSSLPILICFTWLFITIIVLQSDENADMISLIATTKKGGLSARLSKCFVIFMIGTLVTILVEGGYLLFLQGMYGDINWKASIQSIPSLYTSAFQGSVMLWYVVTFLIKIITGYTFSMIFAFLYQCFQKFSVIIMGILFVISYVLVQTISANSMLRIFHFLNLYEISNIHSFFKDFTLFTFHSHTIPLSEVLCIFIIICLLLFTILFLFMHIKVRKFESRVHLNLLPQHTNLCIHEFQKVIINNKFFMICILLCIYQGYYVFMIANQTQDSIIEDKVVSLYRKYGGKLNPDKRNDIESQYRFYEEQELELSRLAAAKEKNQEEEEAYQTQLRSSMDQMKDKSAFYIFYKDYQAAEDVLVYKKGYQAIFAMNTQERDIQMSILLIASLVFAIHGIFTFDQQNKEDLLYETTKNGRKSRKRAKFIVVGVLSCFMFLYYNLTDFFVFNKLYPMFQWNAPFRAVIPNDWSISSALPMNISCMQYICLLYCIRLTGVLLCGCVISQISRKTESLLMSCFLSLFILLFPMILYYNGAYFILYATIFDLVQGNLFLYQSFHFIKYIAFVLILAFISIEKSAVRMKKRCSRQYTE